MNVLEAHGNVPSSTPEQKQKQEISYHREFALYVQSNTWLLILLDRYLNIFIDEIHTYLKSLFISNVQKLFCKNQKSLSFVNGAE